MDSRSSKGYYSLVQFCPDASRLEMVNVGVLVFCPALNFLEVKLDHAHSRINKLFGQQDWDFIEKQKLAIQSRLRADKSLFRSLQDLNDYISRRANAMQISPARPLKAEDPWLELDRLFDQLVEAPRRATVQRRRRIDAQLNEVFQSKGVSSMLERAVEVDIPALKRPLRAPYGFQNGRFNLIEPVQFENLPSTAVFAKASRQAVEGQFVYEHSDPDHGPLKLVVVANFGPNQEDDFRRVHTIFDKHSVDLYTLDRIDPLVREIKASAKEHGLT